VASTIDKWCLVALLLRTVGAASLSYNGLAQTPQMGWVRDPESARNHAFAIEPGLTHALPLHALTWMNCRLTFSRTHTMPTA
jgi:hypothetical protein